MAMYRTKTDDMLDAICHKFYGSSAGQITEAVLEANRGLAGHGPLLPAGLLIELPALEAVASGTAGTAGPQAGTGAASAVELWD